MRASPDNRTHAFTVGVVGGDDTVCMTVSGEDEPYQKTATSQIYLPGQKRTETVTTHLGGYYRAVLATVTEGPCPPG